MRLSLSTLDRLGRDTVSGLVIGYEADADSGITKAEQVQRLTKWRRQGWPAMMYHYHMLALVIGYAQSSRRAGRNSNPLE